jgi:transcription termination factor Rho
MKLTELRSKSASELAALASAAGLEGPGGMRKQDLIFALLQRHTEADGEIEAAGVLEVLPDGYGFLRSAEASYLPGPDDVYVSATQIRRFNLRTGDSIAGQVRAPRDAERYLSLVRIDRLNFAPPEAAQRRISFDSLTALYPTSRFRLETTAEKLSTRTVDLIAPIGKGQRALIVSPPKAGKTMLLQDLANAIAANHPEVIVIVLLIDERPEEVTDFQRHVRAEVVSSTFDEPASRHVQVADMVIEKARRLVEHGRDVVVLLDSVTRLARAHNAVVPHSGKVLTGGVDAHALQKPKRFFGAARNIEEGGSLTIIGTALVDTGSRMDEVIFEEFKGTGNCEIHLDRKLADRRTYPAIDLHKSSTRREELLLDPATTNKMWVLRKVLSPMSTIDSMEFLLDKLKATASNQEFLATMNGR